MAIQLIQKEINYGDFIIHHIFYKNINPVDFVELTDLISGLIFEQGISLIGHTIAGNLAYSKLCAKAEKKTFGEGNWPITWIHNEVLPDSMSGYYSGVSGATVKTLVSDTFICKIFESSDTRFCYIGDVRGGNAKDKAPKQVEQLLETMQNAMLFAGLSFNDITHSTFYINEITKHYDVVNATFQEFLQSSSYKKPAGVIVSTPNPFNSVISATLWGIKPSENTKTETLAYQIALSAANVEPLNGSAVKISTKHNQMLCFTGLASNTPNISPLNPELKQQLLTNTINAIESILNQHQFNWKQLRRGIAYFTYPNDIKLFKAICKDRKIPVAPLLMAMVNESAFYGSFNLEVDFVFTPTPL